MFMQHVETQGFKNSDYIIRITESSEVPWKDSLNLVAYILHM
jgi:hypothetical protein